MNLVKYFVKHLKIIKINNLKPITMFENFLEKISELFFGESGDQEQTAHHSTQNVQNITDVHNDGT